MKYIYLIIINLFVLQQIVAQNPDPQLFESTWYLNMLTIDSNEYTPPSNDEILFIPLQFSTGTLDFISTSVCVSPNGDVNINDTTMSIQSFGILIGDEPCQEANNITFEDLYLYNFFSLSFPEVSDLIAYEILTESNGNKQLILINSNDDIAVYGDQLLGTTDNALASFSIESNPVQNMLSLLMVDSLENSTVEIYDITGKLQLSTNANINAHFQIDVSGLASGIYLVLVTDGAKKSIKKFIKE
jgi:hypothetical protein